VPLPSYYAYFGAPVIGFDFGYWGGKHRHRHRDRDRDHDWDGRWRPDGGGSSGWEGPGADGDGDSSIFPEEGGGDGGWRPDRRRGAVAEPRSRPRNGGDRCGAEWSPDC
jgi:hypothetical protein